MRDKSLLAGNIPPAGHQSCPLSRSYEGLVQTHLLRVPLMHIWLQEEGGPRQGLIEAVLCTWHMYTASAAQRVRIYLYISYREVFIYLWHAGWGADRLSSHRGGVWNATRILSIISLEILASPGEPAVDQLCITVYH